MRRALLAKILVVLVVLTIVYPGVRQYWADKLFPRKAKANLDLLKLDIDKVLKTVNATSQLDQLMRPLRAGKAPATSPDGGVLSNWRQAAKTFDLEAKKEQLRDRLQMMREQLDFYKAQHDDAYPSLVDFVGQLTAATDSQGKSGGNLGPYMPEIPTNPFTAGSRVGAGAAGTSDWYYNESTGEFRANDAKEHAGL